MNNYFKSVILTSLFLCISQTAISAPLRVNGNITKDNLKKDFNINIIQDDLGIFTDEALNYLYGFFEFSREASIVQRGTPVYLYSKDIKMRSALVKECTEDDISKKLLDRKGTYLCFSLSAFELLEESERAEAFRKHENSSYDNDQFEYEYDNELTLQLAEILFEDIDIERIFQNELGIELTSKNSNKYTRFTKEKLLKIFKLFADLPRSVIKTMKLKRILELQDGIPIIMADGTEAYGQYNPANGGGIDLVYEPRWDRKNSESCLVHEVGHAIWAGLNKKIKQAYIDAFWYTDDPRKGYISKDELAHVSDYSLEGGIGEDFAENNRTFVTRPERMKAKAYDKYLFFRDFVYADRINNNIEQTEYYNTSSLNTEIELGDRTNKDITAPYIDITYGDNPITVERIENPGNPDDLNYFRARSENIIDDISGIQEVILYFGNGKGKAVNFSLKECKKAEGDRKYSCERSQGISNYAGTYDLKQVSVIDNNFNRRDIAVNPGDYFLQIYLYDQDGAPGDYRKASQTQKTNVGVFLSELNDDELRKRISFEVENTVVIFEGEHTVLNVKIDLNNLDSECLKERYRIQGKFSAKAQDNNYHNLGDVKKIKYSKGGNNTVHMKLDLDRTFAEDTFSVQEINLQCWNPRYQSKKNLWSRTIRNAGNKPLFEFKHTNERPIDINAVVLEGEIKFDFDAANRRVLLTVPVNNCMQKKCDINPPLLFNEKGMSFKAKSVERNYVTRKKRIFELEYELGNDATSGNYYINELCWFYHTWSSNQAQKEKCIYFDRRRINKTITITEPLEIR